MEAVTCPKCGCLVAEDGRRAHGNWHREFDALRRLAYSYERAIEAAVR